MTGARRRLVLAVVLVLLAIGAVASAVVESVWLMIRVGPVPLPVTVLAAAASSYLLVRVARRWSDSTAFVLAPIAVWLVTVVALDLGPGGDMVVPIGLRSLALVGAGALLPAWVAVFGGAVAGAQGRPTDR